MSTAQSNLKEILNAFRGLRIAVVGDVMLDQYIWGRVERISPEAPVPVVDVQREESRVGGAGNVALGLSTLGVSVFLFGVIGEDESGRFIQGLLGKNKIQGHLKIVSSRPTSTKTRVVASRQQVVRIDRESRDCFDPAILADLTPQHLGVDFDAVVLSDYGKGLLTSEVCQAWINEAKKKFIPIIVDPKGQDYLRYRGATIVTPNQAEASLVGEEPVNDESVQRVAERIQKKFSIENILITRSEKGMFLLNEQRRGEIISAQAKEVFDVTGAGDTVVAYVAAGLGAQKLDKVSVNLLNVVQLANIAAGISVAHVGVYSVKPDEVSKAI